jgi:hypothetical protein
MASFFEESVHELPEDKKREATKKKKTLLKNVCVLFENLIGNIHAYLHPQEVILSLPRQCAGRKLPVVRLAHASMSVNHSPMQIALILEQVQNLHERQRAWLPCDAF